MTITEMWKKWGSGVGEQDEAFSFSHVKSDMPIRHKEATDYIGPEFRARLWARDINLEVLYI